MLLAAATTVLGCPQAGADPLVQPVWLCRPGMAGNPCNQDQFGAPPDGAAPFQVRYPKSGVQADLGSTVVAPDGSIRVDPSPSPNRPAVDCFYAYPTVDPVPNPTPQIGGLTTGTH